MSKPLNETGWREVLAEEGLAPVYRAGWTTHNRNSAGPFADVRGIIVHHTAGTNSLAVVNGGRPDLPGPLAHAHLAKSGLLTMLSTGRTNHAGKGSQAVYDAVTHEDPLPFTGPDAVDGNAYFYGIEIENLGNGKDPYPDAQYNAAVRWAAAICRAHRWTENSVIGHKEWTKRKIDPSFNMEAFRGDVRRRLEAKETPVTEKVPGLNTEPAKPQVYREVLETDAVPAPRNHPEYDTHRFWTTESYLRFIAETLIRIEGKL